MDCRNASHFCIAALQQKQQAHLTHENLRNQMAKKILLNFEVTYVWNRPKSYISNYLVRDLFFQHKKSMFYLIRLIH